MNDIPNVTVFRPKDPTAALRARRARRKRKTVTQAVAPAVTVTTFAPSQNPNEINPSVTVPGNLPKSDGKPADGPSVAVRDAARSAATVTAPESRYVARLARIDGDRLPAGGPGIQPGTQPPAPQEPRSRGLAVADILAYAVAAGLASIAAWFSLKGLVTLFPGSPIAIMVMGATMEAAKLIAAGWLAGAWRDVPWAFRGILLALIAGLAVINAAGTFSQLTSAHVGYRVVSAATRTMQATDLDQRIDVAAGKLTDIDRRIAAIDGIVAGAAQRGRANTAAAIMGDQRRDRAALVGERQRAAEALAALKVDRGGVRAQATIAESEAMPIMFAAEVLGIGADPERAIRWLIALLVCCLDPLALALTAAVSAENLLIGAVPPAYQKTKEEVHVVVEHKSLNPDLRADLDRDR
jgi:hypothetical protein